MEHFQSGESNGASSSCTILLLFSASQEEGTRAGGKVGLRDPVVDVNSVNWDAEKEAEANSCKGADFIPPQVMVSIMVKGVM